jgi:hypothetical protein
MLPQRSLSITYDILSLKNVTRLTANMIRLCTKNHDSQSPFRVQCVCARLLSSYQKYTMTVLSQLSLGRLRCSNLLSLTCQHSYTYAVALVLHPRKESVRRSLKLSVTRFFMVRDRFPQAPFKQEEYIFSALRVCLFNLFAATLRIRRPFFLRKLKALHVEVEWDPLNMGTGTLHFINISIILRIHLSLYVRVDSSNNETVRAAKN